MSAADDGACRVSGEHDDNGPITLDPVTVYALAANRTDAKRAIYAALRLSSSVSQDATPNPDRIPALAG